MKIIKEIYFLEYRDLPFFPWRTIPGSEFESYDEVSEWTKKNLGVKTYYNSKGTEEAC